ncbi:MaoC family dehydratase N-terminal domain-containing protein [Hoeflea sp. CAU 1731]
MASEWPEDGFGGWIGHKTRSVETISPDMARRFAVTVSDQDLQFRAGDPAPIGIHWCIDPPVFTSDRLGPDGHPKKGEFLPEIPLPLRMWAGGALTFFSDLRVGETVERISTIESIDRKTGRSGELCFVNVRHDYATDRGAAISEIQNIVHREPSHGAAAPTAPALPAPDNRRHADPVLLFRYSALTFNGHRIHYDYPYATGVEGYADLVVHGPLQATLLMMLARERLGGFSSFRYRGVTALTCNQDFTLHAQEAEGGLKLSVADAMGMVTMTATAQSK